MRKFSLATLAIAALGAATSSAQAAPVQWSGNGHYYEFVAGATSWSAALAAAALHAPIPGAGATAYLATITSADENAFVASLMPGERAWLAGSDGAVEGVWRWVAGPEAGTIFFGPGAAADAYANWDVREPNNLDTENALELTFTSAFRWNDLPDHGLGDGYVVEWSGAVPEPASWAMMIVGFGMVGAATRRRQAAITA